MSSKKVDFKVENKEVLFWRTTLEDITREQESLNNRQKFLEMCKLGTEEALEQAQQEAGK
jgi:hypothetical protein